MDDEFSDWAVEMALRAYFKMGRDESFSWVTGAERDQSLADMRAALKAAIETRDYERSNPKSHP